MKIRASCFPTEINKSHEIHEAEDAFSKEEATKRAIVVPSKPSTASEQLQPGKDVGWVGWGGSSQVLLRKGMVLDARYLKRYSKGSLSSLDYGFLPKFAPPLGSLHLPKNMQKRNYVQASGGIKVGLRVLQKMPLVVHFEGEMI